MEWLFVVGIAGVVTYAVITARMQPNSNNDANNDANKQDAVQLQSIHIKCKYCDNIKIDYRDGEEKVICERGHGEYGVLGSKEDVKNEYRCYRDLPCSACDFVHYYYGGICGNYWPDQQYLEVQHPHLD